MRKQIGVALALMAGVLAGAPLLARWRERLATQDIATGTQIVIGGYTLHMLDEGPSTGPVVLLIHGFGAASFSWRHQRQALLDAGFRVITPDLLGSGASERVAGPVYTTQMQAGLMLALMDACDLPQAIVVGHSYGGRVALQMALLAPQRIRALGLISPEAFATERPAVARWLQVPILGYALAFYSTSPRLVASGLKMVSRQHGWIDDRAVAGYAAPVRVRDSALTQVWQGHSPKDGRLPVYAHLRDITATTLIIWGGNDPVFPASDAERLARILPATELHVLPDVGHIPQEEAADTVSALLVTFCQAHSG